MNRAGAASIAALVASIAACGGAIADAAGPLAATVGRSEAGRPIGIVVRGEPAAPRRLLVVGCIHGDENAGIAIARRLEVLRPPAGVGVWIVPDLNPDGVAAGTRGNADGVDLNRNFPYLWRPLGGIFASGSGPLSEPETRFASRLVRAVRPTVAIWFHQHGDLVDASGGDVSIERRFARKVGLPLRHLPRYPGSAVGWENRAVPGGTAFVVELPAGRLSARQADRFARAALAVAGATS